jgi:hypothetical protein
MSIRLSGAQVTRIREALERKQDNEEWVGRLRQHKATEELVEDILNIVLPPSTEAAGTWFKEVLGEILDKQPMSKSTAIIRRRLK